MKKKNMYIRKTNLDEENPNKPPKDDGISGTPLLYIRKN